MAKLAISIQLDTDEVLYCHDRHADIGSNRAIDHNGSASQSTTPRLDQLV